MVKTPKPEKRYFGIRAGAWGWMIFVAIIILWFMASSVPNR